MKPLVSIIVPVYNLEGYIDNCLKSLVNQTYSNLEILCIDDGSTDRSADVIKSFSEKDSRVIYVYKENGGVSSARNLGLDMFKGEYVMFVDGDDFLHPQAIELFVNCIELTAGDIVCSGVFDTNRIIESFPKIDKYPFDVIDFDECRYLSIFPKMFSVNIIGDQRFNINFHYAEDSNFMIKILIKNPKIIKIELKLYYYLNRYGSATRTSFFSLKRATALDAFDELCTFVKQKSSIELSAISYKHLYHTIFYIRTLCIGSEHQEFVLEKCRMIGKKWLKAVLKANILSLKEKVMIIVFFYFRHLYELARLIATPQ